MIDLSGRLALRTQPNDSFLSELEQESIALFRAIKATVVPGPWEPSPVETKHLGLHGLLLGLRELLLTTPGVLRGFRHSFLAVGRLNFPDIPDPTGHFLWWDNKLAGQKRAGARHLLSHAIRLYRHRPFKLEDIDDNLIGQPTVYSIPKSAKGILAAIGRRYFKLGNFSNPGYYHITEAQMRFLYYRTQISTLVSTSMDSILEIGAGYGGLAAELLQHLSVGRYFIVELPESVPLVYFYLRVCFDCPVQVLYRKEDQVDPSARVVILVPWKLPDLTGEIDLLINTMSFQHMMPESVQFYLSHADRLKVKYLYLVNRDTKLDPTDLIISQYPIPRCYTVPYKKPWLFGPHLEIVYRRLGRDNGKREG